MTNKEKFIETYTLTLTKAHKRKPENFAYSEEDIPRVVAKMVNSLAKGEANLSNAIQNAACRLNVEPNAKAIKEYLNADN